MQFTKPQVIDLHAIVLLRLTEKCLTFSTPLIFRVSHTRFMSSKSHETSVPAHAVMASSKTAHTRRYLSDSSRACLVSCPDINPFDVQRPGCTRQGAWARLDDTPTSPAKKTRQVGGYFRTGRVEASISSQNPCWELLKLMLYSTGGQMAPYLAHFSFAGWASAQKCVACDNQAGIRLASGGLHGDEGVGLRRVSRV